jgi:hypothetical protein
VGGQALDGCPPLTSLLFIIFSQSRVKTHMVLMTHVRQILISWVKKNDIVSMPHVQQILSKYLILEKKKGDSGRGSHVQQPQSKCFRISTIVSK